MIKALIFDVGGVLLLAKDTKKRTDKNLLTSYKEVCFLLEDIDKTPDEIFKDTIDIYRKSSTGEISKEETLELYSQTLGIPSKKIEELFEDLYKKNVIENKGLYEFILDLKTGGYAVAILSTQFHLSKNILIPPKYYEDFDALEISCDDGLKKPDQKCFMSILEKLNIKPEESIFIDDKQENLDAAENLGMKSLIFKDNEQFFEDLKKLISF
ncbi:MAG: HAD family phosphatase [Candidatus Paceibacterota bacterium]